MVALLLFVITLASEPPVLLRVPKVDGRADPSLWLWKHVARGVDPQSIQATRSIYVFDPKTQGWQLLRLTADDVENLLQVPGIRLRASHAMQPLLDRSLREIRGDVVHVRGGVGATHDGRGVLVALIDTGIDLDHSSFKRPDGSSRVVAVWDQDGVVGPSPPWFGYGRECTQSILARGMCEITDPIGHGTHVAGIAAGSSVALGVAPAADIAIVRSNNFTRIADAALYLVKLAETRNQPLVVNISIGGQYGPHDGRTPLEDVLDRLSGPGRIFVAAAGNDGRDAVHVAMDLKPDVKRVEILGAGASFAGDATLEIWHGPGASIDLGLEAWIDGKVVGQIALNASGSDLLLGTLNANQRSFVDVAVTRDTMAEHGLVRHSVMLQRFYSIYPTPQVVLTFSGNGSAHGWITQEDMRYGKLRFRDGTSSWGLGDSSMSLTVPATAQRVIAVTAYAVRSAWRSSSGEFESIDSLRFGGLLDYASRGPTFSPWFTGPKPNIAAPGAMILSSRANVLAEGPMSVNDNLVAMQGTSMAAPHVTGAVALMLQIDPDLTSGKAMAILQASSRSDASTGVVPNTTWGYGKLDVETALALLTADKQSQGCSAFGPNGMPVALLLCLFWRRFLIRRNTR